MRPDTKFLLKRASEEARLALGTDRPEAAEAHKHLAVRYSARAVLALINEDEAGRRA
jgi:hypothetical protein